MSFCLRFAYISQLGQQGVLIHALTLAILPCACKHNLTGVAEWKRSAMVENIP